MSKRRGFAALVVVTLAATAWSGIRPADYGTWAFELSAGLAGVVILAATYRRFQFSDLVYYLAAVHFVVLAIGAKYTYAQMPLFNWLRDALSLSRNHFDRVGHFMQGFVPAMIVRELLTRTSTLRLGKWLSVLCVASCLAFSAFYELLEWWMVAVFNPGSGPRWLGMQGDPWDASRPVGIDGAGRRDAGNSVSLPRARQINCGPSISMICRGDLGAGPVQCMSPVEQTPPTGAGCCSVPDLLQSRRVQEVESADPNRPHAKSVQAPHRQRHQGLGAGQAGDAKRPGRRRQRNNKFLRRRGTSRRSL